jgi:Cdc6-like AAA superfamily ATPase
MFSSPIDTSSSPPPPAVVINNDDNVADNRTLPDTKSFSASSNRIVSTQIRNHLYGRDEEKRQLVELYMQLKTTDRTPKNVALISGSPGCGKTTLVTSSLQDLVEKDGGYFIRGKFEQFESPMTCVTV